MRERTVSRKRRNQIGTARGPINSLGDFFSSLEFSDGEKARLAALAASGSTPRLIINKYVRRTEGYKEGFVRTEHIKGFRPGTQPYYEQATRRIVSSLAEPSHRNYSLYWGLYKDAAVIFIKRELPALDRLLTEVKPPDGPRPSTDMLKAICANASEYAVSSQDISTFYQIWGVARVENFETLLPQWLAADEASAQKRQLKRLLAETAALKALVEELGTTVRDHAKALAGEGKDTRASIEHRRSVDKAVQALSLQVSELHATASRTDSTKGLNDRVSSLAEKVNRLADRVKERRDEASLTDLHQLANDTKAGIALAVRELTDAFSKKMGEQLSAAAGEQETKIAALHAELSSRRQITAQTGGGPSLVGYRSPLIGVHNRSQPTYKLSSELDFVKTWQHYLSRSHDIALTFEQAVAYHRAFLGSPVVVCERDYALSWIHCLAWQHFTLHMAASPTWSSEEDWAPGAEHLFRQDKGRSPQFLVIHNYDAGLPECYLAPSLALWALQRESPWRSKLFLVPTRHDHMPCAQILEHATCFSNSEYIATYPIALRDGVRFPPPPHRELPLGVEPKIVAEWAMPHTQIAQEFAAIQRALERRMPLDLVASAKRSASFIGRYVDERSAIALSMHHQVIPWVQMTYGEAKATQLSSLILTMAGSVD
jgi:hypothetical protein